VLLAWNNITATVAQSAVFPWQPTKSPDFFPDSPGQCEPCLTSSLANQNTVMKRYTVNYSAANITLLHYNSNLNVKYLYHKTTTSDTVRVSNLAWTTLWGNRHLLYLLPGFVKVRRTVLEISCRKGFSWPVLASHDLTFDLLISKADSFMPLPRGSLVPICITMSLFLFKMLRSQVW